MRKTEIFVGRLREGVFNIIASADSTSPDSGATCLDVLLIESDALYRAKFSDAELSTLCLGLNTARNISLWFSDLEVFRRNDDGSVIVFLVEKRVIQIVATLKKIDSDSAASVPSCRRCATRAHISEWSEEDTNEVAELKRRFPYINVELPTESPALKRLRAYYSSADDSEYETSSSDHE